MKKINNKGFAITGILYTLLVMFLLVLVFSLQILRANKNMREKSIEKLESTYEGIKVENINNINDEDYPIENDGTVKYRGKYIFTLTVVEEEKELTYTCTSYLKKSAKIFKDPEEGESTQTHIIDKDKIKFIPDDCNKYELTYIDNNSTDETVANKIELKEVYKFEGDSNEKNS